jgi:cytochrome P450
MVAILLGGLETTTHLLATAMVFLAGRPDLWDRLRRDPAAVPAFVDELLRHDGPSPTLPRVTTCEVTIAGVTIPADALVVALVGSAGRDERRFPDPDTFDMTRAAPPSTSVTASTSASAPRSPAWRRRSASRRSSPASGRSSACPARGSTTGR